MKSRLLKHILTIFMALLPFTLQGASSPSREMHYRLMASDENLNPELRLNFIDSLLSLQSSPSDSLLFLSADIAYSSGRFKRALSNMLEVLKNSSLPTDKRCEALFMLAKSQFKCDDDANGIESCNAILDLQKPDSLLYYDVNCLTMMNDHLSAIITNDSLFNEANLQSNIEKAEQILKYATDNNLPTDVVNKMRNAIIFSHMTRALDSKDYVRALKYGAEMLRHSVTKLDRLALEGNMAKAYYVLGDLEMAEQYYEKVLSGPAWHTNHAVCLNNYMIILNNSRRSQKAIDLMDAHDDIVSMVKGQTFYANLLVSRGYALYNTQRYEEACHALFDAQILTDSINRETKHETIVKLAKAADVKRELTAAQENAAKKNKLITVLAIFAIAISAMALVLGFRYFRLHKKLKDTADSSPEKDNQGIGEGSISATDESTVIKALHLASLNETIASIAATVDDSKISEQEKLTQINALIKEVASYDDLWEIFHIQFEKLHPSFFRHLMEAHPTLTQGEVRMCAYVMLNMSNKEIAAITRRNVRSVETMRYRLTKKMNLAYGETLSSSLAKI